MKYIPRLIETSMRHSLKRNKSILLLGARQTGKTTLIRQIEHDLYISFVQPDIRQRYEKNPSLLNLEIKNIPDTHKHLKPLIILDEVQRIPEILDVVQDQTDNQKANFILTGSSARKLWHGSKVNLLPGRVTALRLDPMTLREFPSRSLDENLIFGSLPGILAVENSKDRATDLESYVTTYLEQEIRAEALVRNIGSFARFLELAASESGNIVNFRKLSQEIGVAHTTIMDYYQILEDCLIAERIEPITQSKTRKKLTKSEKYIFFDLGVRRVSAQEGIKPARSVQGLLFEQFIGLELIRCSRLKDQKIRIHFWRDPDGPEVDWVIDKEGEYIPIEVKMTEVPSDNDLRALKLFLAEYSNASKAYIICQTPRQLKLTDRIYCLPWQEIDSLILD